MSGRTGASPANAISDASVKRVVLVGAGHAHLHVAQNAREFDRRGVELVLIDPGVFWYSGLATGMLGGMYEPALDQIDARRLIERGGGRFIADTAVGLDREKCALHLVSGAMLSYALLSFNVGSEVALPLLRNQGHVAMSGTWGNGPRVWTVKPIANLWRLRQQLEQRFQTAAAPSLEPLQIVVAGGGPTGCEIALNIDALARKCGTRIRLSLISRSPRLISRQPRGAAKALAACLQRRGIELVAGALQGIEADRLLAGGQSYPFDLLVLATGLKPARVIANMNLAAVNEESGEGSGMQVERNLSWTADPAIFGAGDCIDFGGRKLPKLGVFGVKQAPVLLHNLLAALDGRPLRDYQPQKNYLAILNLGCGDGLATWGPFYWRGRASLWWKDRIDRHFLERYRPRN